MNHPIVISGKGLDLFEFTQLVKDWSIDFIQLGGSSFLSSVNQIMFPEFQLSQLQFNSSVKQEGRSPKGYWTFAFINEVESIYWRNYDLNPKSIVIYAPGSEINGVTPAGFESYLFSIHEDLFIPLVKEKSPEVLAVLKHEVVIPNEGIWNELQAKIQNGISNYKASLNHDSKSFFLGEFTTELIFSLKESKPSTKKVGTTARLQLLTDVEHYIHGHISEKITIPELAKCCNISERTLLYTFKKRYKMGPKAYIRVLKLNYVYRVLHGDTQGKTISSIARKFGFWHMGQFHADYKTFFGELPSETVANTSNH